MKNTCFFICLLCCNLSLVAQWNSSGNNISTGNLTIGSLDVVNDIKLKGKLNQDTLILGTNTSSDVTLTLRSGRDDNASGSVLFMTSWGTRAKISGTRTSGYRTNLDFFTTLGNDLMNRMRIQFDGKVGIGTTDPKALLDVNGKIRANEVEISIKSGADFVLNPDYNLKTLSEVESFIKTNNHLPDIQSEKEMVRTGLNISEFQIKLLQKIEELTLYIIEQDKRIDLLEKKLSKIE